MEIGADGVFVLPTASGGSSSPACPPWRKLDANQFAEGASGQGWIGFSEDDGNQFAVGAR
jgi:hypothetical protein